MREQLLVQLLVWLVSLAVAYAVNEWMNKRK